MVRSEAEVQEHSRLTQRLQTPNDDIKRNHQGTLRRRLLPPIGGNTTVDVQKRMDKGTNGHTLTTEQNIKIASGKLTTPVANQKKALLNNQAPDDNHATAINKNASTFSLEAIKQQQELLDYYSLKQAADLKATNASSNAVDATLSDEERAKLRAIFSRPEADDTLLRALLLSLPLNSITHEAAQSSNPAPPIQQISSTSNVPKQYADALTAAMNANEKAMTNNTIEWQALNNLKSTKTEKHLRKALNIELSDKYKNTLAYAQAKVDQRNKILHARSAVEEALQKEPFGAVKAFFHRLGNDIEDFPGLAKRAGKDMLRDILEGLFKLITLPFVILRTVVMGTVAIACAIPSVFVDLAYNKPFGTTFKQIANFGEKKMDKFTAFVLNKLPFQTAQSKVDTMKGKMQQHQSKSSVTQYDGDMQSLEDKNKTLVLKDELNKADNAYAVTKYIYSATTKHSPEDVTEVLKRKVDGKVDRRVQKFTAAAEKPSEIRQGGEKSTMKGVGETNEAYRERKAGYAKPADRLAMTIVNANSIKASAVNAARKPPITNQVT